MWTGGHTEHGGLDGIGETTHPATAVSPKVLSAAGIRAVQ